MLILIESWEMSRRGVSKGNCPRGFRAEVGGVLRECQFQVFSNIDIAVSIRKKNSLFSHSFPRQKGSRLENRRRTSFEHQSEEHALMETEEGSDS